MKACRCGALLIAGAALLSCAGRANGGEGIHLAAQAGDAARVEQLLTTTPGAAMARDATQQTPLHYAVLARDAAVCRMLLERGADVNAADKDGNTPLHVAARSLRSEMVFALLSRIPIADAKNRRGETPLHLAILAGDNSPLPAEKRAAVVGMLVAAKANPDADNNEGMRVIHLVALKGRDELLATLTGTPLNATDAAGRTPLHYAAREGHVRIIDWLLEHGASIRIADKLGDAPLHAAARRFRVDAITRLIERGADVNSRNARQETPLLLLAASTADGNEVDSALVAAAKVLIAHGADVNARGADGQTAATVAAKNEHPKLTELLRKSGGAS